jgi:putative membrane protein
MTQPSENHPDLALPPQPPPPAPAQGGATPARRDPADTLPPAPTSDKTPATHQPYTRIRAAWVGVWAGVLAVILLIIFVGQNTAPMNIQFLWLDGQIPTALALLIAGVGGAVIAMAAAAARILQLRKAIRHK